MIENKNKNIELNEGWEIMRELGESELGLHLLGVEKGRSGYWSNLLATYPRVKGSLGWEMEGLEKFIFERAPLILATQERFEIFGKELQKCVNGFKGNCMRLMSVACGEMEDLKGLDYGRFERENKYYWVCGVDNEVEGIKMGESKVEDKGNGMMRVYREDVWKFEFEKDLKMDVVTSHGFNTHLKERGEVVKFYKRMAGWLKVGGVLVTSFLAPVGKRNREVVNEEDLKYQKLVFEDVLKAEWLNYSTEEETRKELEEAGFGRVKVIYDKGRLYPTVVARKL